MRLEGMRPPSVSSLLIEGSTQTLTLSVFVHSTLFSQLRMISLSFLEPNSNHGKTRTLQHTSPKLSPTRASKRQFRLHGWLLHTLTPSSCHLLETSPENSTFLSKIGRH